LNVVLLGLMAVERQNGNGAIIFFAQLALFGFIFYWLMIRPQRQEAARLKTMITELKKGDEVLMSGGLLGTVVHVKDNRLVVRSGESKVEVDRGRVAAVILPESAVEAKE
jgi:preprotein translocase subunit YajC